MSRRRSKFAPQQHLRLDDLMPDGQELAALATAPDASPEASLLRAEHSEEVRSALGAIPAQYRLILVLHDMEGLGTSEISSIMKLREGTVRVRLHRARLALRKELSARSRPTSHSDTRVPRTAKPRRCREIFAALSDYLDETLEPGMCEQLERHMAGCQPCHAFLADLERTVDRCRSFDPSCDSKSQSKMRKQVLEEYRRVLSALKKSAANPA